MNAGVVRKTLRESLPLLLLLSAAIMAFEIVFVRAMREFAGDVLRVWLSRPMLRQLVGMMLGADLVESVTSTGLMTIGFAHPLLYAFSWTLLLSICTRMLVGEIDRGTADLLLALPASRSNVYASVSVGWLVGAAAVSVAPVLGIWLGQKLFPFSEPVYFPRLWQVAVNLLAVNVTIACATLFVSTLVSRRGVAVAIALAGLLLSFLINFLVQLWPAVERIGFLGLLHYYRPLAIVRSGDWPTANLLKLAAIAAATWLAGMWRFTRRDIPAA